MKKTRFLSTLIAFACAFLLLASCAAAEPFVLPEKTVTIADNAFQYCSELTGTLTIPTGVQSIGANAFEGCSGFTGVPVIPDTVKTIGAHAFKDCTGLTGTLILPPGVLADATAFEGCTNLTVVSSQRIALVIDAPEVEDGSLNEASDAAAKAFCEAHGLDYGVFPAAEGEEGEDTLTPAAMKAIEEGFNVLILPGFSFAGIIDNLQTEYPDVRFIGLDIEESNLKRIGDNVWLASYHEEQAGFLAGYAAVKLGYKHLGFLGGMAIPSVKRFGYGYIQGISAAAGNNPDITLEYMYADRFWPEPIVSEYMDKWYQKTEGGLGVEVVFSCGGGIWGNVGYSASRVEGAKIIGVDADQAKLIDDTFETPGMTVTSAMKDLGRTIQTALMAVVNGEWDDLGGTAARLGIISADPQENHVGLPSSTQFAASFTEEDYRALVADIYNGTISVSENIEEMPNPENITVNDRGTIGEDTAHYKIAILTGSEAQGEEEWYAADSLAKRYPDTVIHDLYPENFDDEMQVTISKLLAFADDPDVKAIISVQAVFGATEAFTQILHDKGRDDILLIAGVPAEAAEDIANAADLVLAVDERGAGRQVAELAAQWDCDVLVHYSFARHMGYGDVVAKHDIMKANAEANGIEFVDRECEDPVGDKGLEYAQEWILNDVPKVMKEYQGKKVCFYCTNCGLQAPLQKAILENENAYYALPCCPSPYHGFQEAFGLTADYSDNEGAIRDLAAYLYENGAVSRFSTWSLPINMSMINGAYEYAYLYAEGKTNGKVDMNTFKECYSKAAGGDVGYGTYTDGTDEYDNFLLVSLAPIDFMDYVEKRNYKIAILTGSEAQGEEEWYAADSLAKRYPDAVIHDLYPENFDDEKQVTISKLLAFADDPDVKAIISVQAVFGATEAFTQILHEKGRDDILLIAGVPAEAAEDIANAADLVLAVDERGAGRQVAELAAQWDCDVLVHYSFARHMGYDDVVAKHDIMKANAEANGIEFVDRECEDPVGDKGLEYAQEWILNDVPKVMKEYQGKKVCFYCTNCGLQASLQKAILENENAYYALPCCPSPYHGFQEAFGLTADYSDNEGAIRDLAAYLYEKGAVRRFSTWSLPINMSMINGAYEYACLYAEDKTNGKVDMNTFKKCYSKAAGGEVGYGTYTDGTDEYDNFLLVSLAPLDFMDYVEKRNYKIAIMTGSEAQGEEEWYAADSLAKRYPDAVIHDLYPENFDDEKQVTISKLLAFADDPDVKAIISVQAVFGATDAFNQILHEKGRDDILLIAGVPAEAAEDIANAADLVLAVDERGAGRQVAELAAQWDCDVLVHYSFARHMGYGDVVAKHDIMKANAEANGIEFVDRECEDPVGDKGLEYAQEWILNDVPRAMGEYEGKKVCFYCTNCGLQAPLQKAILQNENAYYALPCCPSPYHGFQEAFELTADYSDADGAIRDLAAYLNEKDAVSRFSTWSLPINMSMVNGAYEYACLYAEGKTSGKVDMNAFMNCYSKAAGSEVGYSTYTDDSEEYDNFLLVSLAPINFAEYLD